jgi:hypothetical protein
VRLIVGWMGSAIDWFLASHVPASVMLVSSARAVELYDLGYQMEGCTLLIYAGRVHDHCSMGVCAT